MFFFFFFLSYIVHSFEEEVGIMFFRVNHLLRGRFHFFPQAPLAKTPIPIPVEGLDILLSKQLEGFETKNETLNQRCPATS